jgi:hypothetical protein
MMSSLSVGVGYKPIILYDMGIDNSLSPKLLTSEMILLGPILTKGLLDIKVWPISNEPNREEN